MSRTFAGVKTFILDCDSSNDLEYCGWISDKATGWTTKESSPKHPDQLWSLPSLLFNVYWGSFSRGRVAGAGS